MKFKKVTRSVKDIESRLKETFKAIESQDFLQTPFIQDLMKRVQTSLQSRVETAVGRVETAVGRVESAVGMKTGQVKESVRAGVRRGQRNLDENVKKKGAQKLRAFQKKVAQSILERAENVKASIVTVRHSVTQRAHDDGVEPIRNRAAERRAKALAQVDDLEEMAKAALATVAKKATELKNQATGRTVRASSQTSAPKSKSARAKKTGKPAVGKLSVKSNSKSPSKAKIKSTQATKAKRSTAASALRA